MMRADKESLLRVTRGFGKVVWQQNIFQKATHTFCPHGSDHKTRRSTFKHRIQAIEESNKYKKDSSRTASQHRRNLDTGAKEFPFLLSKQETI